MVKLTVVTVLLIIGVVILASHAADPPPTTPHFPEVFMGKCFDKNPTGVDCYSLYSNFSNAAMTANDISNDSLWDPFFAIADFSTPESSILFWSGNMAFALAISSNDPRFVTVEETSTGYIMNNMTWCGTPDHTFDYVNPCYFPSNSTYYGTQNVWNRASQLFAHGALGDIYVLLQPAPVTYGGDVYLAYRNTSIFGATELPNMIISRVRSITVLLLKNTSAAPDEMCGRGSLLTLQGVIEAKFNFTPKCVDNPSKIYDLLCPPPPASVSAQCLAATLVYHEEITKDATNYRIWAFVTTAFGGFFFALSLFLILRQSQSRKGYATVNELSYK